MGQDKGLTWSLTTRAARRRVLPSRKRKKRIESLEAAAAKALLILADALRNRQELHAHGDRLIECVDLLFTELQVEGVEHSEFVRNSLERTAGAVAALRAAHARIPEDPGLAGPGVAH